MKSRVSPGGEACQVETGGASKEGSLTKARRGNTLLVWLDAGYKDGPTKKQGV